MKVSKNDLDKIKDLSVLILYRKTLKYLKNYPSLNRQEIRESAILEYREKSKFKDSEEIKEAITIGRKGLAHLMLYELKRQEILSDEAEVTQTVSNETGVESEELMNKNKEKKDDDYVYF